MKLTPKERKIKKFIINATPEVLRAKFEQLYKLVYETDITKLMKPIDLLKRLHEQYQRQEQPNMRYTTYPNHFKKTRETNGMTACIISFLNYMGYAAERTGNEGRMIDERQVVTDVIGHKRQIGTMKRIPGSGQNGTSDIKAYIDGRLVAIEVKNKYTKDNKQSDAQVAYQQQVEMSGGVYVIARSFDDFVTWYFQQGYGVNARVQEFYALMIRQYNERQAKKRNKVDASEVKSCGWDELVKKRT